MQEKSSPEGQRQCTECGTSFSLPQSDQTKQTDETNSESGCPSCRMAGGLINGQQAQKSISLDPHSCSVCNKTFISSAHLTLHLASHNKERRFRCNTCGKYFHQPSHLVAHEAIHSGNRPFKCPDCGRAFGRASHLKTHRRLHTGEKPYKCSCCDKAFAQKSGLLSHVRLHTGERLYRCEECGASFGSLPLLLSHKAEEAARQGKTPHAPRPDGAANDIKCGVCCRTFIRSSYIRLQVHLEKGLRPYHCKVCNKTFIKMDTFIAHCDKHLKQKGEKSDEESVVKPPMFIPLSKPAPPPEAAEPLFSADVTTRSKAKSKS
uniref:zinc finger protein 677-like n=1 Tax=Doryrhamphus excisus TaxID=161450 RepID=UPI0025AEC7F4|nr:zinc finger protein 677-like [Doryrhamphus excisus]